MRIASGSSSCSIAWIASRVSSRSRSAATGDRALQDDRPGVHPLVDEVHRHPGRPRPRRRAPGRSRRGPGRRAAAPGWTLTTRLRKRRDEAVAEQLHVAGEDDQVGLPVTRSSRPSRRRAPRGPRSRRAGRPRSRPRPRAARCSACASGLSEPTPTTSIPSRPCSRSRIACRLVPAARGEHDDCETPAHRLALATAPGRPRCPRARTCRSPPRDRRAGSGR